MSDLIGAYRSLWARLVLCALLATQLTGCATLTVLMGNGSILSAEPMVAHENERVMDSEDEFVAMGSPKPATDAATNTATDKPMIAIVGVKHSYVLTKGGDILQQLMSSSLDKDLIKVGNNQFPLKFDIEDAKNGSGNAIQLFSAYGWLTYSKNSDEVSATEAAQLKQMGFEPSHADKNFYMSFDISGIIYPPANNLSTIQTQFKKTYPVQFYKTITHSKPDVLRIIALPFAVGFDIVTSPIQFL